MLHSTHVAIFPEPRCERDTIPLHLFHFFFISVMASRHEEKLLSAKRLKVRGPQQTTHFILGLRATLGSSAAGFECGRRVMEGSYH